MTSASPSSKPTAVRVTVLGPAGVEHAAVEQACVEGEIDGHGPGAEGPGGRSADEHGTGERPDGTGERSNGTGERPRDPRVVGIGAGAVVRTEIPHGRVRDLLLCLALARGRTVSASHLVDALWPESAPQSPRAALHTVVARLRALGPGTVVSGQHGYALAVPSDIDLAEAATHEVRRLLGAGRPDVALDLVRSTRALCGAPGASPSELDLEVDEVRSALLLALDRSELDAHVALGAPAAAATVAELLTERLPTDEAVHLALMRCYAALGRTNDALRVFSRVRDAVADELGTTPGVELVRLNTALLQGADSPDGADVALDPSRPHTSSAPSVPSAPSAPSAISSPSTPTPPAPRRRRSTGLRSALSPMIGRVEEVDDLLDRLGSARLVTVLGPGGLGKTRTAQEVAHRTDASGRRVVVVELASVRTDEDVTLALATALEVREEAGGRRISDRLVLTDTSTRITERLGEEPTLLVLDNCEHVVDGASAWTAELLGAVESLSVLTTSRSPLLVAGEQVVRLAPLATVTTVSTDSGEAGEPGTAAVAGPAVELFETRARAVREDVALPRDVVARLCERLDGLPLAIELAAARVSSMTVEEIESRLARRFELLTGGGRTAPERHRTLEAVIGWSWELLSPPERALLRRASVLPSGFSAEAAQTVADLRTTVRSVEPAPPGLQGLRGLRGLRGSGAVAPAPEVTMQTLDLLAGLVDQSLLTVREDAASGTARFRMLETVREFGALRLQESDEGRAAQDAFFVWAVEHSEREWPLLTGPGQVPALGRARLEQENLVHVLRQSTAAGRGDVVLAVFGLLGLFWILSGAHSDVVACAPEVLSASAGTPVLPERAGTAALALLVVLTTTFQSEEHVRRRALLRLRDVLASSGSLPTVVRELGAVALEAVDLSAAGSALARARGSEDGFVAVVACVVSAQLAENGGDLDQAQEHALAGYELAVEHRETWGTASAAMLLGQLASEQARHEEALGWLVRARDGLLLVEATADLDQLAWLEASNLVALGRVEEAEELLAGLAASTEDPDRASSQDTENARAVALSGRAEIAYAQGDVDSALSHYESARALMRGTRSGRSPWYLVFGSSVLCLAVLGGATQHARRSAPTLRARTLAQHRLSPGFTDYPILGTASLALGAYLVHEPALGRTEDGLLLVTAAARLGSRQDVPSLLRSTHEDQARRALGEDALERARRAVGEVPRDDVVDLVLGVLQQGPWEV